jgi:hypothetical protein
MTRAEDAAPSSSSPEPSLPRPAPAPPWASRSAPPPPAVIVTGRVTLEGYSSHTFGDSEQHALAAAMATAFNVSADYVTVTVTDVPRQVLITLPSHLLQEVLGCLGAADVARAAMTCTALRQASRSEPLWRGLLAAKLGTQAEIVLPSALPDER